MPSGPNTVLIHTPIHASWLNQVENSFSIVQPKVLNPERFSSLADLEERLMAFPSHYERTTCPFKWTFTRNALLAKIKAERLRQPDRKYVTVILNQTT